MDDARDIWNAVKARFGGNAKSKKMKKSMLKQEFSEFRIGEAEGLHKGYDMMQKIQTLTLKTKGGLELLSFDDLYYKLKTLKKAGKKIDFDKKESARFNKKKTDHDGESDGVIASKEFGMIAGCDTEDAIKEGAAKIYNLITRVDTEEASTVGNFREFALMGVTFERVLQRNQLTLEDKIRVLSIELENTSNLLKHSERINADVETAKRELQTKLDNHLVQTEKWRISSKNLFRLNDSSMSIRTKVGLGFNNYIRENELGWDDSTFSVFTTNSEDVEGRPLFNRFAKADSMNVVPPPLYGDYTFLSDHIDLDESYMSYGTKTLTSSDSKYVSNDFVSCDDGDKSLEVNTNDFASSDSSFKSSEPKPNDSTSCTSTSSVSTSENEAEIESNAGHFRNNASSVSKLCFVCGSGTYLIKDYDFYEKQMVNKTVGIGVAPVHSRNKVNHQNQYDPHVVLLRTSKVNIPPARPQPVPTGKPKVFAPVPTGRQNRPFPVPTDRGYSPSENPFPISKDEGVFDSGCSRSMTGNKERLDDFQVFQSGKVMFRGGEDIECLVLSKNFKLPDESMVVLRVPKKHNLYTINLNNLCPRGKQHKSSYKAINDVNSIFKPLQLLHMDLFGPTSIRSIEQKYYCLVITDDYSNFCWVFFLEHKDETYPILKDFINLIENQLNKKVKAMRCDNGTEFKMLILLNSVGPNG
uniref:Ribonuclease H-like domain-containing protein n=1 Tax=Tanacetum cinerariifolium TaxID=118510 RepID=A0A699IY89_TANCI|nr:ribonuclease H-like domain-containing protein [Tanacetum cinerariifolium]